MSYSTKFENAAAATAAITNLQTFFVAEGFQFAVNPEGIKAVKWAIDNGAYRTDEFINDMWLERGYKIDSAVRSDENPVKPAVRGKYMYPYGIYAITNGRMFFVESKGQYLGLEAMVKHGRIPKKEAIIAAENAIRGADWYDGEKTLFANLIDKAFDSFSDAPKVVVVEKGVTPKSPLESESAFMGMLHTAFVNAVGENLVAEVMPTIKDMIVKEFGFVPERHEVKIADKVTKIDGIVHQKFELVCNLVANDMNPYLCGPAGTGKNVLAQQIAESLGLDFYTQNSVTDEYKFTGFIDVNGNYIETEFYKAFTKGGLYFLDEMDASAPEVLVNLNMAIANKMFPFPTGTKKAHPDFRVIAAGNTLGTGADASYVGRMQLDAATLNRFVVVEINYDERIDTANANGDAELVEFAKAYRKVTRKHGINTVCSYRNIKTIAMMSQFADDTDTLASALVKDLNKDDINIISNDSDMPSGNKWVKALKNVKPIEW